MERTLSWLKILTKTLKLNLKIKSFLDNTKGSYLNMDLKREVENFIKEGIEGKNSIEASEFLKKSMEQGVPINGHTYFLNPETPIDLKNLEFTLVSEQIFRSRTGYMDTIKMMVFKYTEFLDNRRKEKIKTLRPSIMIREFDLLESLKKSISLAPCTCSRGFIRWLRAGIYRNGCHISASDFRMIRSDFKFKMIWSQREIDAFRVYA